MNMKDWRAGALLAMWGSVFGGSTAGGILAAYAAPIVKPTEEQRAAGVVERALQKHGPDVHRCFAKALADRLDAAGKVEIEVQVAGGGKVAKVNIVSGDAKAGAAAPSGLAACVQAAATAWVIEGVEAGSSVVLPFTFQAQMNQFVIKAADVPERGPAAPKGRRGMVAQPAFKVKVLADALNTRSTNVSLTLLTVGPASRVAMHRHPRSGKILYVLKGHARLLGPSGATPLRLDEGSGVYIPAGYPHVIENMGRQQPVAFLQAFSPPGPERVYRDPSDVKARTDFEVIRDGSKLKTAPSDPKPLLVTRDDPGAKPVIQIPGGKGKVREILESRPIDGVAGIMSLSILDLAPGAELPSQAGLDGARVAFVVQGAGTLMVGSESHPFGAEDSLSLPAGQAFGVKVGADPTTVVVVRVASATK